MVYAPTAAKLIENSIRTSHTPGSFALGGFYGESSNNDIASNAILQELNNAIEELKFLHQTNLILISRDFNVVNIQQETTSFHDRKPRTAARLANIIKIHNLTDLGIASGNRF